jgi:hypothetical protein
MGEIYLPQFAGKSNPYDVLWYLAIEMGRINMLKIKTIGHPGHEMQSKTEETIKEQYDEITKQLEELSQEEREFLMKDSRKINNISIDNTNQFLMELGKESMSNMSYLHTLDSYDYLIATLGEEAGKSEYQRRVELVKKFKSVNLEDEAMKELSEDDVNLIKTVRDAGFLFFYT